MNNTLATRNAQHPWDAFLDDFFGVRHAERAAKHAPGVEVYRGENEYRVVAHVPGVKKEDLSVSVEDGFLKLDGKYEDRNTEGLENAYSELHSYAEFSRKLRIDETRFDVEKVEAKLENGVLTVRLPIREEVKPKSVKVQVA